MCEIVPFLLSKLNVVLKKPSITREDLVRFDGETKGDSGRPATGTTLPGFSPEEDARMRKRPLPGGRETSEKRSRTPAMPS